jgi:hypothetical protein
MDTRRIALIVALIALCVTSNYVLISIYNVKFMDLIVFIAGFVFGPLVGIIAGAGSWAMYGIINPLGFSIPIWVACMFSEMLFGIAGGFVKRLVKPTAFSASKSNFLTSSLLFGVVGMLLTIAYDVLTNVVWGYVYGPSVLVAVLVGFVPMGLIHMVSNAFFFGACGLPAVKAVAKVYGKKSVG